MNISVCITVLNEQASIEALLDSLLNQTKRPNEIVVVDGGSNDSTTEKIRKYTRSHKNIKLIVKKCTRSQGRNIGIRNAKNKIIALTDAGCQANKKWLENITKPFNDKKIEVVAGFYKMIATNSFEKAESVFLGILPSKFDSNFLPSARSMAFKKSVWSRVGGFSENLKGTAEDSDFVYKIVRNNINITRMRSAVVYWNLPKNLKIFFNAVKSYSIGDIQSKIFWHPIKKFRSHNIKVLLIIARYIVGFGLLLLGIWNHILIPFLILLVFLYIVWSFYKVYKNTKSVISGMWGIVLQVTSDIAASFGFVEGLFNLHDLI